MGTNESDIDNRYSPIYQRGGTNGSSSGGKVAGAAPARTESDAHRSHREAQSFAAIPETADLGATDSGQIAEVIPTDAQPGRDTPRRGFSAVNPFVVVLWILGIGLTAFGLWVFFAPLQVDETSIMSGPYPQWIYLASQSAGGLLVSGTLLLGAAITLSALLWERGRNT
ncbi:tetraspanin family protein [Arthrobacter sp. H5]|uniref:tetraspanin family protein n=1 Tax=Arthrobacter sp. H5 TaxID=1267973 RepID=UPI0004804F9E|nr:tetraspanin family protein [Arthrobacter sp. H5]